MATIQEIVQTAFSSLGDDDKAAMTTASSEEIRSSVESVIAATRKQRMLVQAAGMIAAETFDWSVAQGIAAQTDAPAGLMFELTRDFKAAVSSQDPSAQALAWVVAGLAIKYLGV
jgi:hypothetical protein